MSNRPSPSKGAIPKQRPIPSIVKRGKGKSKKKDPAKKEIVEWQLPAFSLTPQKKTEINWEMLKHDTARRQAPEGEDIKEIRRILKEVKNINVPVHEFINMVGPYTSDNGAALRSVMAEDLESFRQLAKKVYETMTQDVSDVLVNEQLQMVQYYEEKTSQLNDKMMKAINEIYEMAPDFDFEKFLKDKEYYVQTLFPMPKQAEIMMSDEACEMVRRQQAYHRLQWLKSEGERMSEENKRLLHRLEELKKEQQEEQNKATEKAAEAEAKRQELAEEENQMKEKLEKLNESIEKSFIREEARLTKEHNRSAMQQDPESTADTSAEKGARRFTSVSTVHKKLTAIAPRRCLRPRKLEWSCAVAAEIEEGVMKETAAAEAKKSASRTNIRRPKSRVRSPHFSPIKTPPLKQAPKEVSPFHYSPPKTPPEEKGPITSTKLGESAFVSLSWTELSATPRRTSPFHYSPPEEKGPITSTKVGASAFVSLGRTKSSAAPRRTSPFHYSPPEEKGPVTSTKVGESDFVSLGRTKSSAAPRRTSPFHYSPPGEKGPVTSTKVGASAFVSLGRTKSSAASRRTSPSHKSPPGEKGPVTSTKLGESDFFSLGRTKSSAASTRTSPFHYSPPKSPPPMVQETFIQQSSKTVQQKRPQPRSRENMAPRDTWGGFY